MDECADGMANKIWPLEMGMAWKALSTVIKFGNHC